MARIRYSSKKGPVTTRITGRRARFTRVGADTLRMVGKPFTRAVGRIIDRRSETKMVSAPVWSSTTFNGQMTQNDARPVIPEVLNGNADYNRVGDKIRPVSLSVRGSFGFSNNMLQDNRPLICRLLCLSQRNIKTNDEVTNWAWRNLLKPNSQIAGIFQTYYDGTSVTAMMPINKELFTVHKDITFKLLPVHNVGGPTQSVEARPQGVKEVKFTVKGLPTTLRYDDAFSASPGIATNAAPFFVFGYYYADGSPADIVNSRIVGDISSYLYFKDE